MSGVGVAAGGGPAGAAPAPAAPAPAARRGVLARAQLTFAHLREVWNTDTASLYAQQQATKGRRSVGSAGGGGGSVGAGAGDAGSVGEDALGMGRSVLALVFRHGSVGNEADEATARLVARRLEDEGMRVAFLDRGGRGNLLDSSFSPSASGVTGAGAGGAAAGGDKDDPVELARLLALADGVEPTLVVEQASKALDSLAENAAKHTQEKLRGVLGAKASVVALRAKETDSKLASATKEAGRNALKTAHKSLSSTLITDNASTRIVLHVSVPAETRLRWAEEFRLRKRIAPVQVSACQRRTFASATAVSWAELPLRASVTVASARRGTFSPGGRPRNANSKELSDEEAASSLMSPADILQMAQQKVYNLRSAEVTKKGLDDSFSALPEDQPLLFGKKGSSPEFDNTMTFSGVEIMPTAGLILQLENAEILDVVPLHDASYRAELKKTWVAPGFYKDDKPVNVLLGFVRNFSSVSQPIDSVRGYLGSKVALYFCWLQHYTSALWVPAILGILLVASRPTTSLLRFQQQFGGSLLFSFFEMVPGFEEVWSRLPQADENISDGVESADPLTPIYCVLLGLWSMSFCESWKHEEAAITTSWGLHVSSHGQKEVPRPGFRGEWRRSPITGKPEIVSADSPRVAYWKSLAVIPLVASVVAFIAAVMVVYFWLDDNAERLGIPSTVHSLMPVGYGILIPQFSSLYRKYAARLTEWENHRTAGDYDRNLILKLLLFEFFNCYGLLFYVAFYKEDFVLLRSLLAGILITRQVVGQVVEAIVPWYVTKAKLVWKSSKVAADAKLSAADAEFLMEPYELFDDYLEMVVQLGYVVFFASAFPLAPLFALLNNLTEIRSDAFKLLEVHRYTAERSATGNIGIWQTIIEVISVVGLITNLHIIGLTSPHFHYFFPDPVVRLWGIIVLEHVLLCSRFWLALVIPDVPPAVQLLRAKIAYAEKKCERWIHRAAHRERLARSKAQQLSHHSADRAPESDEARASHQNDEARAFHKLVGEASPPSEVQHDSAGALLDNPGSNAAVVAGDDVEQIAESLGDDSHSAAEFAQLPTDVRRLEEKALREAARREKETADQDGNQEKEEEGAGRPNAHVPQESGPSSEKQTDASPSPHRSRRKHHRANGDGERSHDTDESRRSHRSARRRRRSSSHRGSNEDESAQSGDAIAPAAPQQKTTPSSNSGKKSKKAKKESKKGFHLHNPFHHLGGKSHSGDHPGE